jgi:hypothetical protein
MFSTPVGFEVLYSWFQFQQIELTKNRSLNGLNNDGSKGKAPTHRLNVYSNFSTHPFCFGNFNLPPAGKGSAGLVLPMQILHQPILGKIFGYDRHIE